MIWAVAVVFAAAYVLIATEKVNRTAVALAGAGVVVAIRAVDGHDIFFSADTGIDWNVIFLLLGMMIIVGVLKQTGVFEYLAIWAAKRARGKPFRVMVLLCVITAVASALLDNVTTILLIAPVTFLVCERLGVTATPYIIAEVAVSNVGGIATLVGDPPNIIIGSRAGLTYNDFLIHMLPIAVVLVIIFCGLCRLLFGRQLKADPERAEAVMQLTEREAITNPSLLIRGLVVLGLVLVAFVLHPLTHMEPSVVALLGAGLLVLISRLGPADYLQEVEWETLAFFAGLFIMVGALVKTGVIGIIAEVLTDVTGGNVAATAMTLLFGSAVLSGVVDNIPYVATMSPVVASLTGPGGALHGHTVLWWALVLGADLGGNATAIGASANVVAVGLAKRSGQPISFWHFTKYGLIITAVTVITSAGYLALRYL